MKYFKNLHAGWADLEIEDFKGRISYVRNIPYDILRAYEEYLIFGHCIIPFDEEGSTFNIYVSDTEVEVIIIRSVSQDKKQIFIIKKAAKAQILKILDKLSINESHLFPEIADVTNYIKSKY